MHDIAEVDCNSFIPGKMARGTAPRIAEGNANELHVPRLGLVRRAQPLRAGVQITRLVLPQHLAGRSMQDNLPRVNPERTWAETRNRTHVVTDEHDGASAPGHVSHFSEAFLLKSEVAHG